MAGLILHFLNGLFDMNFYLEKGVPLLAFEDGGTAIEVKSGSNQRNRRLRPNIRDSSSTVDVNVTEENEKRQ